MKLYPLKFEPKYSYRIWGGEKLKTVLNKNYTQDSIGESWEISDVEGNETLVNEGILQGKSLKDLIGQYKSDFVGNTVYQAFGDNFPLLIKFIDAKTPLSIQVHPSNELAKERHNSFGKNEMWYVMQAEEDAELIVGFNQNVEKESYQSHLNDGSLMDILNVEKVHQGDTFYIPTGRVHAIGAGVLLAEIQQTSNVTYRIYDYDRVDKKTGKKRELHTELALDAIDFKSHPNYRTAYSLDEANISNKLVHSPYFKTNIIHVTKDINKDYSQIDSFVIYMCVEGSLTVESGNETYPIKTGETLLIPACIEQIKLTGESAKILEIYL
ncbi:class I mannose-6-phosphate isomerase [Hyunsoonleella sp. SJ7]|uniref:Phosphohexomutase n=1 Tax=Hyunsoonleella aquatilis TaxID=2762758 RepID=A0A923KKU3_9FLAO|nr:type I phosphomannose isomerase catalytic subunit [Hyunsoonleella aquatilis]MBC3758198.1 class I mannose-6-phosphate isomerase [Hyunsoonleella aquatilis]